MVFETLECGMERQPARRNEASTLLHAHKEKTIERSGYLDTDRII